ncbi:MAG: hypothetical protein ACOWWR_18415 [Eubacteriales bacterium]
MIKTEQTKSPDLLDQANAVVKNDLFNHIEEFAAAFLKKTGITSPEDVVMCYEMDRKHNGLITKVWFEKKIRE